MHRVRTIHLDDSDAILTPSRSIVGSGLGGTLADPVRNYPAYFSTGTIFERYPYLLPNLVCATLVVFSMIVGILFLEETHEEKRERRDVGLEIGDWIMSLFHHRYMAEKGGILDESFHLLAEDMDVYSSTEASPALAPTAMSIGELPPQGVTFPNLSGGDPEKHGVSFAFTRQVCLVIVSYGILAYHTISAEQLLPVLLSLPESNDAPSLPFRFLGGFGLTTKSIGKILSMQGIVQTFVTILIFPVVSGRFGSLTTYRMAILSYPLFYLLVPYLTVLPDTLRAPCLYLIIVWKVTAQAFSFPPLQILLANSSPSKKVLGTLNGTAASSASLCRAFGPTLSGLIQSAGLSLGVVGLPWWATGAIAVMGAILCLFMTDRKAHKQAGTPTILSRSTNYRAYPDDGALENASYHDTLTDTNSDVESMLADK